MNGIVGWNKISSLTIKNIESAYSGQDGKCCCGCKGKHYHKTAQNDYRGGGTPNDLRQINRILNVIKSENGQYQYNPKASHVNAVVGNRVFIVYLEK